MSPLDKKKSRDDQIMHVRENIRYLRSLRGWSQYDMARELKINRSAIGGWERAMSIPKADTLQPVADAFNISVNQITNSDLRKSSLKRKIPEMREMEDTRIKDLTLLVDTQKELIATQRELLAIYRKG